MVTFWCIRRAKYKMTIKEILTNTPLLNCHVEVNGELYNEQKHGDLVHIHTTFDTYGEYNHTFNTTFYSSKVIFSAIEREKILKLLESKENS